MSGFEKSVRYTCPKTHRPMCLCLDPGAYYGWSFVLERDEWQHPREASRNELLEIVRYMRAENQ